MNPANAQTDDGGGPPAAAHPPMSGGTAPTKAPGMAAQALRSLSGVYRPLYQSTASRPSAATGMPPNTASAPVPAAMATPAAPSATAGRSRPEGMGRRAVRGMAASARRSWYWFKAQAPAASANTATAGGRIDAAGPGGVKAAPTAAVRAASRAIRGLNNSSNAIISDSSNTR